MRDVTSLLVTQNRIFRPDALPYQLLITPPGTELFQTTLRFRRISWSEGGDYMFQDGAFTHADGPCVIQTAAFNQRRIWLQVLGDSSAANRAYEIVLEGLALLAPAVREVKPVLFTEETSCVVTLDFDWSMLLNPVVAESAKKATEMLSGPDVKYSIKNMSLLFSLSTIESEELKEVGIAIGERYLSVEPRQDAAFAERRYFTASPLNCDAHLRFVEELEKSLLESAAPRRKK